MRNVGVMVPVVLAVLALAASQAAFAQVQMQGGVSAAMGGAGPGQRGQERAIPQSTFQGQAEYPPPGYLAEFEETPGERSAQPGRDTPRDFAPVSPAAGPSQQALEFAPGGYDRQFSAPTPGRAAASTSDPRWPSRPPPPTAQPQWPGTTTGGYLGAPQIPPASERPERGMPAAPAGFQTAPAYPSRGRDWPR